MSAPSRWAPKCDEPANGARCPGKPWPGYNPLALCEEHLRRYRARIMDHGGQATPMADGPALALDFGDGPSRLVVLGGSGQ